MDPEFQRALIVVLIVGTIIMGVGAVALFFIFRSFGGKKPHVALIAGLISFIFVCCLLLFALARA